MKKRFITIIITIILLLLAYFFIGFTFTLDANPFSSKAKNNKEIMQYAPVLREDFSIIKENLEVLRNGETGKNGYTIYIDDYDGANDIYIYTHNQEEEEKFLLSENTYNLPDNELQAIELLYFSDKLNKNIDTINYGSSGWYYAVGNKGGMFASTADSFFHIGIFYFENNEIPVELQNSKDYTEELGDNYWLVVCNMQRA